MKFLIVIFILCHVHFRFISPTNGAIEINNDDQSNEIIEPSDNLPIDTYVDHTKPPTILIVTLFRNKAHTMPLFFTYLNRIEYPKKRISLWLAIE